MADIGLAPGINAAFRIFISVVFLDTQAIVKERI